jgi:hypothetical protein
MEPAGAADNNAMSSHLDVVVRHLTCQECERSWVDPRERWRMYVTDDEPRVPVAYCHEGAAREFDGD